ncbi:MAG: hypothetical protein EXR35_09080 [Limnohabitans sp.]|nr:hypothetical protein [Limnohabitans sp.]
MQVSRLRKLIEKNPSEPQLIQTVWALVTSLFHKKHARITHLGD